MKEVSHIDAVQVQEMIQSETERAKSCDRLATWDADGRSGCRYVETQEGTGRRGRRLEGEGDAEQQPC